MIDKKCISEVADVTMGQSPSGETYNNDGLGLPLLNGPTEFGNVHPHPTLYTTDSKREGKEGDLIFCVRGSTTGRMNWADQVYSLGRGVCTIRGETQLDTRFIGYTIKAGLQGLLQLAGGGTFPNLRRDDIGGFEIPFPDNRHRIASILSAYDDLIENNLKRIKLLEEAAQNIYREWFVELRFPDHDNVKWIEDEEGRRLPEGWQRITIGDLMTLNYGKGLRKDDRIESGEYPVYGSSGIVGYHDKHLIKAPGIILGRKGNVGSVYYSQKDFYPIDTVYFITSNHSLLFAFHLLLNETFINTDAAVPGLNRNYAYSKSSVLPSQEVIAQFDAYVQSIYKQIEVLTDYVSVLQEARDILLPRLMNQTIVV
jgi:type I restriction enzyme, S subunit